MKNKILIVAGMHRSGTSLVTQWLHKCGLHMGENFLGPAVGNADGHFEDVDFLNFHEDILRDQLLPQSGLTEKPVLEISLYDKEKLKNIIKDKNNISDEWGWKDPRTCLFLTVYRELLPDARYLILIRDYQSTVSSLINRNFKNADMKERGWLDRFIWKTIRRKLRKKKLYKTLTEQYLKVWIAYNEAILTHICNRPKSTYLVLDYKMFKTDDKQIFLHLKDKWNFSLYYCDFENIYKENLINRAENIEVFVKNKKLLDTAKELENNLRAFIQLN